MIGIRRDPLILVHFDPRIDGRALRTGPRAEADGSLDRVLSYGAWARRSSRGAVLLAPEMLRRKNASSHYSRAIFYRDEADLVLPHVGRRALVWMVNGRQLPVCWFESLGPRLHRRTCDVTFFAPPETAEQPHYAESVCVDEGGRVVRFRRHYCDSPVFADRWSGEAAALFTTGAHLRTVAAHLVVHGWGLESIGLLSRRLSVGWADLPLAPAAGCDGCTTSTLGQSFGALGGLLGPNHSPADSNASKEWDTNAGAGSTTPEYVKAPRSAANQAASPDECQSGGYPRPTYHLAKRFLDICGATIGLAVSSPLLLLVGVLVKCTSRGPVFFLHRRQGLHGKEFFCIKFRTMTAGAHELQDALRAFNEVDGPQFKIDRDPRLTGLGAWLRRLNIDELPQLINVLVGQMSLVGPRPSPDDENQLCPAWRRARLSVKPGMTGLWQVLRRRRDPDMDFQEWIYYDVEYAKRCCLWLDFQILLHTPLAIFASHRLGRFVARLQRRGICCYAEEMGWKLPTAA